MKRIIISLLAVLLVLTLVSCNSTSEPTGTPVTPSPSPISTSTLTPTPVNTEKAYTDITVDTAKQMIDAEPGIIVLDVREQSEFDSGHIEGATLIPVPILEYGLNVLDKEKKIIVYCQSGVRSVTASEILVKNGFHYVYNMLGGIIAWSEAGYPISMSATPTPSPTPITPLTSKISPSAAKTILETDKTAVFVDVRPKVDYDKEHIPGAISIPSEELGERYSEIPAASQIIVYAECLK